MDDTRHPQAPTHATYAEVTGVNDGNNCWRPTTHGSQCHLPRFVVPHPTVRDATCHGSWGEAPHPTLTGIGVTWLYGFQFEIKVIAKLPEAAAA